MICLVYFVMYIMCVNSIFFIYNAACSVNEMIGGLKSLMEYGARIIAHVL